MRTTAFSRSRMASLVLLAVILGLVAGLAPTDPTRADHTPDPASVTIAGSLQSVLGCPGDWQPECSTTFLAYDAEDDAWQASFSLPAGDWEYKAALNGSWDENYGANAAPNGANIALNLPVAATIKFYYNHKSHWVTSNHNTTIVTAPGSFQSELGCGGDWDPGCLRTWLQDIDGDGIYTFSSQDMPVGEYEFKIAIAESWDENYGQGGAPGGPNIPFSVAAASSTVTITFNASTKAIEIVVQSPGHNQDNNVEYFGLGHDSHDSLYRVPFGAVTPGTEVILRFRTYHNDVTSVQARFYNTATSAQSFQTMTLAASDVSCYDPEQPDETCDYWQITYTPASLGTVYYRFIVKDGSATAYYADDSFFDGSWGVATPQQIDNSYAVTVYDPEFTPVEWLRDGVVYQIFPDRFRNGRSSNDPSTEEARYGYPPEALDQILDKDWGNLPEGYCWRYEGVTCFEGPRGRDYFGGDLRGVQQRLNYLEALGVTAIYFNPIFESASNHGYDTQDYFAIDHFFGTAKDFTDLIKEAEKYGIRVILDGVFNHVSSDSPYFDRYGHFETLGACESVDSIYRDWFFFNPLEGGPCAGPDGPNTMTYSSWFGFDSLPVLNKDNTEVQALVYGEEGAARYWLEQGASAWRLDVMGDPSFPADFWPAFRAAVKETDPQAAIIGELWKKHEVLAFNHGGRADTAMNYRFRNAILGFFGRVDDKGFPDDGQSDQPPSVFARKLLSIREDNPDAVYTTMMNLMGSHDTERILWALTPGAENRTEKEFDATNLALGKQRLRLAAVVQFTVPGAPTIYYGDEVGVTGDDDPDDRRTFPWEGTGEYGHAGDQALLDHYQLLAGIRAANPVFRSGEMTFLLVDDTQRTLAYLLRGPEAAAIVAINRNEAAQTLQIPLDGQLPDAVVMSDALGAAGSVTASAGVLSIELPGLSAAVLLPVSGQDLTAPSAPTGLSVTGEGDGQVDLSWTSVTGAAKYKVYRSPVTGGGYVLAGETSATNFNDISLRNGATFYYIVKAVDAAGNLSGPSNEASAIPHLTIGWANLQWPPTLNHTISTVNRTDTVYGQVWIDGVTNQPGPTPGLLAQLGYGPDGSDPAGNSAWTWVEASFNVDVGNNDEFMASLLPEEIGTFDYAYRYSTTAGQDWVYADLDGIGNGYSPSQAGSLTVNSSGDTTPPATPVGLQVTAASPSAIELAWEAVSGDPSLHGYEVLRGTESGGPYTKLALVTTNAYSDTGVSEGETYFYVVRAVDTSFNRSGFSNEVQSTAEPRTVSVTFNVTVPATTDATGSPVYIAGTLHLLDGGLPEWDPAGVVMTQVDATHWTITLTGKEGTAIEYKYVLGDWFYVEKGAGCEELGNRTLTLDYGLDGVQAVEDTVLNWRNVAPCGD